LTDRLSAASYACEVPVAIDAHALITRLRAGGTALAVELGAARSVVTCDPRFLEEALHNLIANAREAMSDGGTPIVSTRNASGSELRAEADREYLVIAVRDTGEGMSEATRNQAFELFFSAKSSGTSRGIGLAQAKDTARRAGGVASIDSRAGEGTTVTLAIPLTETD
jgi:signal transduction histidine kinase